MEQKPIIPPKEQVYLDGPKSRSYELNCSGICDVAAIAFRQHQILDAAKLVNMC